ncbi:MAG: hypothetical protein ACK5Q5_21845 [Planctomycetaceae bacterium]
MTLAAIGGSYPAGLWISQGDSSFEQRSDVEVWRRVLRCGSIPLPRMEAYIRSHRDAISHRGRQDVAGSMCDVLELTVGARDFGDAFYYFPRNFVGTQQAILRTFVAESFGYAVKRVEYSTVDGDVQFWFDGSDFREVAPGIFFPFVWTQHNISGPQRIRGEFQIAELLNVNEPVDDTAFSLSIPKGTRVRDERPGRESVFIVGESKTFADVDEIIQSSSAFGRDAMAKPGRGWGHQVLIWLNVLVVLVIVVAWRIRRPTVKGS